MRVKSKISMEMLQNRNKYLVKVSQLTGVPTDDIMSESRTDRISTARHLVFWALLRFCNYTTTEVGVLMRKHRTSVIYGRNSIDGVGSKWKAKLTEKYVEELKKSERGCN